MADEVTAHCMKCKGPKEMKDPSEATMKNGGTMMKGTCSDCGTKMCKIVGKKKKAEE